MYCRGTSGTQSVSASQSLQAAEVERYVQSAATCTVIGRAARHPAHTSPHTYNYQDTTHCGAADISCAKQAPTRALWQAAPLALDQSAAKHALAISGRRSSRSSCTLCAPQVQDTTTTLCYALESKGQCTRKCCYKLNFNSTQQTSS